MAKKRNFQRSSNCFNILNFFHLISSLIYLSSVVISTVKSDQIDCKDIQCPPDIKCPEDSILHNVVLYEPPSLPSHQIPPDYNDHDYNDDDEVEKNNTNDKIIKSKNNMDGNDNNNLNVNNNNNNENRHNQKQHISKNSKTIIEYNHDDDHLFINNEKVNFLDKINKNNDNNNNNNNNDNENTNSHEIIKRSVEYKQRESIKIIPGDYISLIPMDGLIYNSNNKRIINLENQKKRKRRNIGNSDSMTKDIIGFNIEQPPLEVSPLIKTENLTGKCCPKQECICKGECKFPKCEKYGKITIQIEIGTNESGKCCPKYKCIDDVPDCMNSSFNGHDFWIKDCMRCECIFGHRVCHESCNVADSLLTSKKECFSSKQQRPYKDGEFWIEDNCTECECLDGERKCQISLCKPKNCPKQIKMKNECCPICVDENDNSTTITISNVASSSSITSTVQQSTETTTKIESFTTSSSSYYYSSELPQSTEVSSKSDSSSMVIPSTISLEENPTKKNLITNSYLPEFETTIQTVTSIICNNSMMITSPKPLVEHPERILNMLGASKESLILCAIIVGLMILCAIFVALYLYEVTKRRTTYRSIPSSDSNLSQIPRPVKTSAPPLPDL